MSSKYSWHPPRPPSPPNPTISSKIAAIGPIAKCLEVALEELCSQEYQCDRSHDYGGAEVTTAYDKCTPDEAGQCKRNAMDEIIAKSILQNYIQSVASTSYDNRKKGDSAYQALQQTTTAGINKVITAPAALLKGEIQHFNRIGGQWRIIVKNATLMPRQVKVGVGRNGRKRVILDWKDDHDCDEDDGVEEETAGKRRKAEKGAEPYRIEGTVEVLAYNDDT